ncbi:hypothetical protein P691DRAFT_688404, partial [Macrolepiota fuliginosa MF-IS2]
FKKKKKRLHSLDQRNPGHLWLLHYLFLESINNDCMDFQGNWNHHPISGQGHNLSPMVHSEIITQST